MIRLTKEPEPQVLTENCERWTSEYAAYKRGGNVPKASARRYADTEIREALGRETLRKCAYCESRIEYVASPHIEHILPKKKRPELVCEWLNLTLACARCNNNKGDYYEPDCELVNPYRDEIADHLIFAGAHVFHRSSDNGRVTISQLDLNRSELVARRKEAIENLTRIRDLISSAPAGPVREVLEAERDDLLSRQGEYSAAAGAFHSSE